MGNVFSIEFEGVAVTAAVDFFEVTPADDKPLIIHGILLSQSSDVGDAAEEILRIRVIRGHTTGGSGGAAPTPVPLEPGNTAGFTAETNNTTIASAGTGVNLYSDAFNIRTGYQMWFPPEDRPKVSQGNISLVIRLMAAPADALTMSGTLIVEEL